MKRGQRWSAAKKGGDSHLDSDGGPLRRRKALRHLDSLALDPQRDLSPAAAHVRVLGELGGPTDGPSPVLRPAHQANGDAPLTADAADEARQAHEVGARVQPVPIEQPLGVDRPQ
jgi:hypothetical protein